MSDLNLNNSYGFGLSTFAPPKVTSPWSRILLEMFMSTSRFSGVRDLLEHNIRAAVSIFPGRSFLTNFRGTETSIQFRNPSGSYLRFLEKLHDISRCYHFVDQGNGVRV